jgi:hypothetical protein
MRRPNLVGAIVRLPEIYPGVAPADTARVYRAAVAHAGAHLAFGGPRIDVAGFEPLAVALISLIEDARVEASAMAVMPGLRRLWLPFHTVAAGGANTAPRLMERLARALIDPNFRDGDHWVEKGRRLFADAMAERPHDPALSIDIGSILGRDLGQTRLPFNGKDHVVEPVYRDAGLREQHTDAPGTASGRVAHGAALNPRPSRVSRWRRRRSGFRRPASRRPAPGAC